MASEAPEIFGLSLLDTVTCGLGGAIILFVIIMSQIKPPNDSTVVVKVREQRVASNDDVGPGETADIASMTATVKTTLLFRNDAGFDPRDVGSVIIADATQFYDDEKEAYVYAPGNFPGTPFVNAEGGVQECAQTRLDGSPATICSWTHGFDNSVWANFTVSFEGDHSPTESCVRVVNPLGNTARAFSADSTKLGFSRTGNRWDAVRSQSGSSAQQGEECRF